MVGLFSAIILAHTSLPNHLMAQIPDKYTLQSWWLDSHHNPGQLSTLCPEESSEPLPPGAILFTPFALSLWPFRHWPWP